MPKYKRLSEDDLLLAIDRTYAAIDGQRLIVAKLLASATGFAVSYSHRQLVDTHILTRMMLEADLEAMETEQQRRM